MQELQAFDGNFGLSASKYMILSYSNRFLTKNEKIENFIKHQQVRSLLIKYVPADPILLPFPLI